jgi:lysozyme family protein
MEVLQKINKVIMGKKAPIPTNAEYIKLYTSLEVHKEVLPEVNYLIDQKILPNKQRYVDIRNQVLSAGSQYEKKLLCFVNDDPQTNGLSESSPFGKIKQGWQYYTSFKGYNYVPENKGIPWFVIAFIHYLECNFDFNKHLFNGDSLKDYTHRAPSGQPRIGHPPPFTFEESAVASIKKEEFHRIDQWPLPVILKACEQYNGFGYEKWKVNTPYLWGGSNHYQIGKFVEHKVDGTWKSVFEPKVVSKQIGVAVIMRIMHLRGLITVLYK